MKDSKFYKPLTLKERLTKLKYMFLFWKGRKKGVIHTMNIGWREIRPIFFPKGFYDKYSYLGAIPYNESSDYFKAIYPLVLAMDYEARPKWCPRWFLRFTHLFGNDASIVRIRNYFWHNVHNNLTKGITFVDYKTKWQDYDLRISIYGPKYLQDLADDIEHGYYSRGKQKELAYFIKQIDPRAFITWGSVERLEKQLEKLIAKQKQEKQEKQEKL